MQFAGGGDPRHTRLLNFDLALALSEIVEGLQKLVGSESKCLISLGGSPLIYRFGHQGKIIVKMKIKTIAFVITS